MLRRSVAAAALLLLAGCQGDFSAKGLAQSFKGDIDWVRDLSGQPIAKLAKDTPQGPFPDIGNDPRPQPRSRKQNTDLIAELGADHATAGKIGAALAKSDRTAYLTLDGAKPTAQPIPVALETVELPDGVRDLDSFDPRHAGSWFALRQVDFDEGSAELPEEAPVELALRQAARLAAEKGSLRVVGYSGSQRLSLEGKGPHEANRWLAELRARKVAEQLIAFGAPPRQLLVGPAPEADRASGDKVEVIIDY
jgi:outer membrane protein OmpA-like peptidoglycan-associated protein